MTSLATSRGKNKVLDAAAAVGIITGLVGTVTGIIALVVSTKASNKSNQVALGQIENEIRRDIAAARTAFELVTEEIEILVGSKKPEDLTEEDKRVLVPKRKRQLSAKEELLNTFEGACSQYRDGKVDRLRFHKNYNSAVRKLFEKGGPYDEQLHPKDTSPYKALWRVFIEWNDMEDAK